MRVINIIWTQNTYYARVITVIRKQCTYYMYVVNIIWSHNEYRREVRQAVSLTITRSLFYTGITSYGPYNCYLEVIGVPLGGQRNQ